MSLEFSSSDESPDLERVISVLDDAACREIVAVLEEPLTVPEIAEETGCPLSTTYRKLDRLTEAGLVKETTGVRQGRHHKSRYVANFDQIAIGLEDDRDLRVDVKQSNTHSLGIWANTTQTF